VLWQAAAGHWDAIKANPGTPRLPPAPKNSGATVRAFRADGRAKPPVGRQRIRSILNSAAGRQRSTTSRNCSDGHAGRSRMSAPVRTVFRMSSSAAHRLDCYGQVEVNFFKTGLPLRIIGIKRQVWPKQARRTAEWLTNAGSGRPRTARQLRNPLSGHDYASYSAISGKARHRRSWLSRHAVRRYRRQASPASSSGQPPRVRLQARQRRPRQTRDPSLSRASQHSEYDPVHRVGAAAVQGIFPRLIVTE
jgi:hypothetical protein